jgi:hypothetical protein
MLLRPGGPRLRTKRRVALDTAADRLDLGLEPWCIVSLAPVQPLEPGLRQVPRSLHQRRTTPVPSGFEVELGARLGALYGDEAIEGMRPASSLAVHVTS